MDRNQFGMRVDGGNVRRAKPVLAAAMIGALCLLGALSAAAESDSLAPQTPEVVVKRASSTGLLFTWSPVERATGYDVYLGLVHVGPTTFTRAEFPNLVCNTRYVLRVAAFDGAGRRSTPSLVNAQTGICASSSPAGGDSSPKPPPPPVKPPPSGSPPPPPPVKPPPSGSPPPPPSPSGPPSGPPPSPGGPPTASIVVSPSGSDKNACSQSAPCATFDRAYHVARPGQVVQVVGGSYPAQSIKVDASKDTASANVIFQPAPGATVTLANSALNISGAHVELHNFQMSQAGCTTTRIAPPCPQLQVSFPAHDVLVDGLKASLFFITGAYNVTIRNSDFGPSWDNHGIIHANTAGNRPHDITLINNAVHDQWNSSACKAQAGCIAANHMGCGPTINDAYNVLEDHMRFYNCEDLGQLVKPYQFPNQNITIQNSFFGASNGFYSLSLTSNAAMPNQGLKILNNVLTKGVTITAGVYYPNSVFSGNTLPGLQCAAFISAGWVIGANTAQCGGGGVISGGGAAG